MNKFKKILGVFVLSITLIIGSIMPASKVKADTINYETGSKVLVHNLLNTTTFYYNNSYTYEVKGNYVYLKKINVAYWATTAGTKFKELKRLGSINVYDASGKKRDLTFVSSSGIFPECDWCKCYTYTGNIKIKKSNFSKWRINYILSSYCRETAIPTQTYSPNTTLALK